MTMEVPTSEVGFGALMVEVSLTASFPLKNDGLGRLFSGASC